MIEEREAECRLSNGNKMTVAMAWRAEAVAVWVSAERREKGKKEEGKKQKRKKEKKREKEK